MTAPTPRPITNLDQVRALRLVLSAVQRDSGPAHVLFGELEDGGDVLNLTMAVADIASVAIIKSLGAEKAEAALLSDLNVLLS